MISTTPPGEGITIPIPPKTNKNNPSEIFKLDVSDIAKKQIAVIAKYITQIIMVCIQKENLLFIF